MLSCRRVKGKAKQKKEQKTKTQHSGKKFLLLGICYETFKIVVQSELVAVAEWITCLFTVVSRLDPSILPLLHACRERDWLPCWPPRGWQVLHQR